MSYRGRSQSCYGNLRRVQRAHALRSNHAKRIDESLRVPLAKTSEQWLEEPNRFDVPEVDTPEQASKEEQDRRLEEIRRLEASRSPPTSHSRFRANLTAHRLYGTLH